MIELLLDQGADPQRRANEGSVTVMDIIQVGDATEAAAVLERRLGGGSAGRRPVPSDCGW
jgi:hypothetical protein